MFSYRTCHQACLFRWRERNIRVGPQLLSKENRLASMSTATDNETSKVNDEGSNLRLK
jgi:hypothetical protein